MPDHPDHEQLAAFQAGDGDRRQLGDVAAHLAGCPSCAAVVASVERARGRLALLEEPDLPPGLHDRLVAATEVEAAKAPATRPASRFGRVGSATGMARPAGSNTGVAGTVGSRGSPAPGPRPVPWYRRRVAWAAAAALVLAALVAVPLLDQPSDLTTTASGAGGGQDLAAPEAAGSVPLLRVPGEVSAASVRSSLASDTRARSALDAATSARGGQSGASGTSPGTQPGTPGGVSGSGGSPGTLAGTPGGAEGGQAGASPGSAGTPGGDTARPMDQAKGGVGSSAPAALLACLPAATAAADPATRPLTPAFFLEGSYRAKAATVLVTASTGQPGRVDLWVFPRDSCSGPPLATERVR